MSDLQLGDSITAETPHRPRPNGKSKGPRRSRRSKGAFKVAVARVETRRIDLLVLGFLGLIVSAAAFLFNFERTYYPGIWLGATPTEVRYGFGEPISINESADNETWEYQGEGYSEFVSYKNGRADELWCNSNTRNCPGILGISPGDSEDALFSYLGTPNFQIIRDGVKIVRYDDLGLEFLLSKFQVITIKLKHDSGNLAQWINRYFVFLLP